MNSNQAYIHRNYSGIFSTDLTLREWMEAWAPRRASGMDSHSANQILGRVRRVLILIGDTPLQALTLDIIQNCIQKLLGQGITVRPIHTAFAFVNQACEDAVLRHFLAFNPCAYMRLPKYKRIHRKGLSDTEYRSFIEACAQSPYGLFFRVMTSAALRFGEVQALTWRQVNFMRKTFIIDQQITIRDNEDGKPRYTLVPYAKYGKKQTIHPSVEIFDLLADEKENQQADCRLHNRIWDESSYIFKKADRHSFRTEANAEFHAIMDLIGCSDLRLHDLRHTGARLKFKETGDLWAVRDLLRHTRLSTTIEYLYSTAEDMQEDINKLDEWYRQFLSPVNF